MSKFDQMARDLVDQHYAAGPDLKQALTTALQDAAQHRQKGSDDPRQRC